MKFEKNPKPSAKPDNMPTTPGDASLDLPPQEHITSLANLYDRFAHALDPFAPERDEAERAFFRELSTWYDNLPTPKPSFQDFSKAVIARCRKHLIASSKPPSV